MRTGVNIYSGPECWLNNIAINELAFFYNLPDFNTVGASDAKVLDQQAAADDMAGIMQAILAGSNLIHDVGYIESGYTASWEGIVMGNEIIDLDRIYRISRIILFSHTQILSILLILSEKRNAFH